MTGDAAVFLVILPGIPIAGLFAAFIAWSSLKGPVSQRTMTIAWIILLSPYVVAVLFDPQDGLGLALRVGLITVASPLAAVGLAVSAIRRSSSQP